MQEGGGDHPREQGSRPLAFVTSSLRTARQPAVGHRGHHEETPPAAPGWGCWTLERPPGNVPANPASLCPLSPGVHPHLIPTFPSSQQKHPPTLTPPDLPTVDTHNRGLQPLSSLGRAWCPQGLREAQRTGTVRKMMLLRHHGEVPWATLRSHGQP